MRKAIIPAVLIILLLVAYGLRWDQEASKTFDEGVLHWVRDRWTGRLWLRAYGVSSKTLVEGSAPVPTGNEVLENIRRPAADLRDYLTYGWWAGLIVCGVWAVRAARRIVDTKRAGWG